jgi:hypothetical protein
LGYATFATTTRNGVNVCPEAWYLQRIGAGRSAAGEQRLGAGTYAHRQIGRQTDRLRDLGNTRRWLLAAIALFAALLLLQGVLVQQWMPHP